MKIADLKVNVNAKLTQDEKKNLQNIINNEFANKESLFHQVQEREKEKILVKYRKDVGYEILKKDYDKAETKTKIAEEAKAKAEFAIAQAGLDIDGDPADESIHDYRTDRELKNYNAIKLNRLIDTLEKNAPSENLRSKLLVRLQLATTKGEALVIMKEILGNGQLPEINPDQITYKG